MGRPGVSAEYKDIAAPSSNLGELMVRMKEDTKGIDRLRFVLASRMNQYSDIELDEADSRRIARAFHDIEAGSCTSLIMICSKDQCMYKERCALYVADKAPEGRECLHENYMLLHYLDHYTTALEIDIENLPEMVLVNQLVEYEVIEYRCNAILSTNHRDLRWFKVAGIDKEGNVVESEEISYALVIKESVQKRKLAILQDFTATRKEKWKKQAALKESKEGPSRILASMKARISEIKNKELNTSDIEAALEVNSGSALEEL